MNARSLQLLAAAALAAGLLPAPRLIADDAPPAAAQPAELYDQTDRKKTMLMKLPRTWKPLPAEQIDENKALAGFQGFFGEEKKSPQGAAFLKVLSQYARASLARSVDLPLHGEVKKESARPGTGWAEGCAIGENATWRRYVEKNGRVYLFEVLAAPNAWNDVHALVEKLLDTATVPGEYAPPSLGDNFKPSKAGAGFEVLTDAAADRDKSIGKAADLVGAGRDVAVKALPGKPSDAGKPLLWVFQNGTKYEDRVKAAVGVAPEHSAFLASERAVAVRIIREQAEDYPAQLQAAGAQQYVWQYFGGDVPIWLNVGLGSYGRFIAHGGGKGKLDPSDLQNAKSAAAAGKRRLDNWFELTNWNEVTDNKQGEFELFAWQVYFRSGRGAKKYKKQFDGYIQALRDKGDPLEARKAFEGVNFEEMLQDFKNWTAEWK